MLLRIEKANKKPWNGTKVLNDLTVEQLSTEMIQRMEANHLYTTFVIIIIIIIMNNHGSWWTSSRSPIFDHEFLALLILYLLLNEALHFNSTWMVMFSTCLIYICICIYILLLLFSSSKWMKCWWKKPKSQHTFKRGRLCVNSRSS